MDNDQTSRASLSNGDLRRFQWLPLANPSQPDEGDEGGLNLGQVVASLRRRLPVIAGVTTLVASAAVLKALTSTPTYQGSFEILTKPVTVETQVISSVPQTLSNKEQQETSDKGSVDDTKLKLLTSPKLLEPIAKKLKPKYSSISYDQLAGTLKVTPTPKSEILSVSFQDKDREKVKAVLKQVSAAYLDYSLEERLADVRQGIDFVDNQLPQLQKRVAAIQDRLQTFRQQYNLIDPESTGKELSAQSLSVSQQLIEAQIKLSEARAIYTDLNNQLAQPTKEESGASSVLQDNKRYQALLDQLLEVESQIAKKSSTFRETAPHIQVLEGQQRNLLPLLQREGQRVQEQAASKIRDLEARVQILTQAQNVLNQRIKQLSTVSRQYTDIQQELKIATDNLNQFLTKREALRIDAGQRKTPWQILTPPGEPIPSTSNVKRMAMLGVILGILMGVGVALLLDKLSNAIHTPDDIKNLLKRPILGVIPFNPDLEDDEKLTSNRFASMADLAGLVQQVRQRIGLDTKSHQHTASPFLEAFRSLYTNIRLLNSDTQIRSLVISSSVPGEGKSTVSVYLAQAAAALGQRVLLVDTDLRLPQLHNRLGLLNTYGLSNVISLDLDVDRVIQQSPIEEKLFVLTAGQVPPDPTKLLSSQKMQNLMEKFQESYDLVIYDTPPLQGLADTRLVASKSDGIVVVVGLGKTKSSELTKALETLKLSPVAVLGMIANGSKEYAGSLYDSYHRYYSPSLEEQLVEDEILPSTIKKLGER
jgi:capsular exopolysaccharide synthesis family protein